MLRRSFKWREDLYSLDRATLTHWPNARLIAYPEDDGGLRLITSDALFVAFATNLGCAIETENPLEQQAADCRVELLNRGYSVWSIREAVELIIASPESDVATGLITCLEHWFFIQKIEA
jgi:hypothetical protein